MSQRIQSAVAEEAPEAEVWLKKEVHEYADENMDEPLKWELDNVRVRQNGWVDMWGTDENGNPYAQSVPPRLVIRIIWPDVNEG